MGKLLKALDKHQRNASLVKTIPYQQKDTKKKPQPTSTSQDTLVHVWRNGRTPLHASLIPYTLTSRILLLGEGDFSFASCLQVTYPELDFIATGLDSFGECTEKYDQFTKHAKILSKSTILHRVDATKLHKDKKLQGAFKQKWEDNPLPTKIVFHFPHTGTGIKDRTRNIRAQQSMLLAFFKSVLSLYSSNDYVTFGKSMNSSSITVSTLMMTRNAAINAITSPQNLAFKTDADDSDVEHDNQGETTVEDCPEVHLTLKEGDPYDEWDIKHLAKLASKNNPLIALKYQRSFKFDATHSKTITDSDGQISAGKSLLWPGYKHARTLGDIDNPRDDFEQRGRTHVWSITPKSQ